MSQQTVTLKERCSRLLKDEDIKLWYDNLNSESAKRLYLESLCRYSEHRKINPNVIVEEFRKDIAVEEKKLQAYILGIKSKYAPKVVHNNLVGVKSWLRHNGITVVRKINVGNVRITPTIEDEYPPGPEELRRILSYGDVRVKANISLIAFAGIRPSAAAGLKVKDFPDLKIIENKVSFEKTPAPIKVRAELSKNGKSYLTFLSSEGCEYVAEYLNWRIRLGNTLSPQSNVLASGQKARIKTYSRKGFHRLIKRVFEKAGFPFRPYVLRSYFDTAIMNARSIPYDYQHFWMGHSGSIEATYTVNKMLPDWQIEEMRKVFKQYVEPKLSTIPLNEPVSREELALDAIRKVAAAFDIDPLKVRIEKQTELKRELKLDEEMELLQNEIKLKTNISNTTNNRPYQSKIIDEKEIVQHVEEGWEIIRELNDQRFLIKRQNHISQIRIT